ncbi:Lrp/AsnC family transcriptional regulator [Pseudomonas palleroniana]|uniref:Lrp/AsnC family transcriptional regulator n=1 Tax=Pseudomonas palleroniana TaxID=191390 RepID=A0A2L1J5M6_9PSED|nr:Lrp/AsnC family transcriptional regulator [Pseudomonas palleroniana]AVE03787.1 Lrp/AsnC family transcriptional regulator [Pseudomonas palleroniana]
MKSLKLDKINRIILQNLQNNARISNLELAEKVNLSPSACLQRTKALENAGYIQEYMASVNIDAICINVMAFFMFSLRDHSGHLRLQFARFIEKRSEIIACLKVDGGIDFIAVAACSTVRDLDALREQLLDENPNILKINTNIILDKTKRFTGYPLEDLKWRE